MTFKELNVGERFRASHHAADSISVKIRSFSGSNNSMCVIDYAGRDISDSPLCYTIMGVKEDDTVFRR